MLFQRISAVFVLYLFTSAWLWAQSLTLGVVPQFPRERISSDWTPLLAQIQQQSGIQLQLKFYKNIPEFEQAFLAGEMDVAYLNPYHAVMAYKAQQYQPIVRDNSQLLTGLLMVSKDSDITKVEQLAGKEIAFPAPNAFGASLYMRALLTELFRINFIPMYRNTHSNVYRHVISKRVAAGGAVRHTLDREPPEIQAQLRVLYETPPVNPHPVVVHPRVSSVARDKLQAVLLTLGQQQPALMKMVQLSVPVKASYADYAPLEKLGLAKYVVLDGD